METASKQSFNESVKAFNKSSNERFIVLETPMPPILNLSTAFAKAMTRSQ